MGTTVPDRIQAWRRVAGALIAAVVLWSYAQAVSDGGWPLGHPWSGITLSLLAVQCFLPLKAKSVSALVVPLAALVSAVVWLLSREFADEPRSLGRDAQRQPIETA